MQRYRNRLLDFTHDILWADSFHAGFRMQDKAVTDDGKEHLLNVIRKNIVSFLQKRAGLSGMEKCNGTAGGCAKQKSAVFTGAGDKRGNIGTHFRGTVDVPDLALHGQDIWSCTYRTDGIHRGYTGSVTFQHVHLLFDGRIAQLNSEKETVDLRFRQRIRTGKFSGILCGKDHERLWQRMGDAVYSHLMFFHDLQKRTLGFRTGPVNLICQKNLGHDRAFVVFHFACTHIEQGKAREIAGHQIRRKLHTAKRTRKGPCQCRGQGCLPHTGYVFDEYMSAAEKCDQCQFDGFLLSDNCAGHIVFQGLYDRLILHGCSSLRMVRLTGQITHRTMHNKIQESSKGMMTMERILAMLSMRDCMTGEAMSREMGITRAAVWKKIEILRAEGWNIESLGRKGYRLHAGDRLDPVLWQGGLRTQALGRGNVFYAEVMDSTNDQLRRMAAGGAPHGSLCLCEQQTGGKGRLGRQWVSRSGEGLWQSVLLRPALSPQSAPLITLAVALSMAQALENVGLLGVRIKWPNDLVINGRKVCGILCEASADMDRIASVICGVGLNVKEGAVPDELRHQATSLETEGLHVLRRRILTMYLERLESNMKVLEKDGFAALLEGYTARSCTLGSRVHVVGNKDFLGMAEALDTDGALLVRDDAGFLQKVLAGDVSVRGVMGYV